MDEKKLNKIITDDQRWIESAFKLTKRYIVQDLRETGPSFGFLFGVNISKIYLKYADLTHTNLKQLSF